MRSKTVKWKSTFCNWIASRSGEGLLSGGREEPGTSCHTGRVDDLEAVCMKWL